MLSRNDFLAACFILTCFPVAMRAEDLARVEIGNRGKAATALVEVKLQQGYAYGSAFCIHPSGIFVTNAHVVQGLARANLVLDPSLPTQQILNAKVVRINTLVDLAVLRVEGKKDFPSLPLGTTDGLAELAEVVAVGFPFGKALSADKKDYPAASLNIGSVTALRRKEGELHLIQLDAAINPGNSGGPVLDKQGQVVGVVVAGVKGAGVNFAIPVTQLRRLIVQPEVQFFPPPIDFAKRQASAEFKLHATTLLPPEKPLQAELLLKYGADKERRQRMENQEGVFRLTTNPFPEAARSQAVRLTVQYETGQIVGLCDDISFRLGKQELELSKVHQIELGNLSQVTLRAGKLLAGPLTGLEKVVLQLGKEALTVELRKAKTVTVDLPYTGAIECTAVLMQDGKEIGRFQHLLVDETGKSKIYLSDMQETIVSLSHDKWYGKNGKLGIDVFPNISVDGVPCPKGIGTHASEKDWVWKYNLDRKATLFQSKVAIDDSNEGARTGIQFEVIGDGRSLWRSKVLEGKGESDLCNVNVAGIDELRLRVCLKGNAFRAHAVWVDPFIFRD